MSGLSYLPMKDVAEVLSYVNERKRACTNAAAKPHPLLFRRIEAIGVDNFSLSIWSNRDICLFETYFFVPASRRSLQAMSSSQKRIGILFAGNISTWFYIAFLADQSICCRHRRAANTPFLSQLIAAASNKPCNGHFLVP